MEKNELMKSLNAYVDYLLENSDAAHPMWNIGHILAGVENEWNYEDGCVMSALLALYKQTRDEKYFAFVESFVGSFVNEDGSVETYDTADYNIDDINSAKNLFYLYDKTGKEKYRKAIEQFYNHLCTAPRISCGNFWHKLIYPNQVWLDGLYMAQPFYMMYENRYNEKKNCIDVFTQFQYVEKYLKDPKTGLYYHGYDDSRAMYWADQTTGCSSNFWLRASGWLAAAFVDVLEVTDEQMYDEKCNLERQFHAFMDAILKYQDATGMFYQVIDKKDEVGNYLETSGTLLISYALLKGARLGFLPSRYRAYGEKAFYGTTDKYLLLENDKIVLGGICLVAGLGGAQRRDGSLAYYFSEPVVENDAKGVAPLIMAFTEMLRII